MPYAEVEPDEVKARLARGEDVFLLDVREPDEVEAWAYPIGVQHPARAARRPPRRAAARCHDRRGLPRRGPLCRRGQGTERRRVDGREPHRRRGRLGGRRARRVGAPLEVRGVGGPRGRWGWWGSNPRPKDYESSALTTELQPQGCLAMLPTGRRDDSDRDTPCRTVRIGSAVSGRIPFGNIPGWQRPHEGRRAVDAATGWHRSRSP